MSNSQTQVRTLFHIQFLLSCTTPLHHQNYLNGLLVAFNIINVVQFWYFDGLYWR